MRPSTLDLTAGIAIVAAFIALLTLCPGLFMGGGR